MPWLVGGWQARWVRCSSTPPDGVLTLRFSDIEGSTRLREQRPEEARSALAAHGFDRIASAHPRAETYISSTLRGSAGAFGKAEDSGRGTT